MKKPSIQTDVIRKVLKYIKKYRILLLLSVILAAVTVILTLYIPILIGNAIDCIIGRITWILPDWPGYCLKPEL